MKRIKYKFIIGVAVIAVGAAACKKSFLDQPPQGVLSPDVMATEAGVQGILIGAYSMVDGVGGGVGNSGAAISNWAYGGVASDDAYKGSDPSDIAELAQFEQFNTLVPTNGQLDQKWVGMYKGAQRANDALRTLAIAKGISANTATQITAQARFLRAFFHWELKKVFGNIIYADESVTPQNINVDNKTDVWPRIEEDLKFAVANLPETWSEAGRANKTAAKALLAKVYMQQNKYTDAYPLLQDVITNGKVNNGGAHVALFSHFYSNFNPQQKNGPESIWAAQTTVKDNSSVDWGGDPNGNYGDLLNFPYNGGPGACCGFYNPSQDLANAFKTDANGLPYLNENYATAPNVDSAGGAYSGFLDPRIDWTMGRKGIPYLDWGAHPGDDWIRNPVNDGHFSPKKNVYAKSQKDGYTDAGSAYWGPNELVANNVNLIRFADVLLMAAECAVKANDLATALNYVNMVRNRAANPEGWVYKNSAYNAATATYADNADATKRAANYKISPYPSFPDATYAMTAIRFERRLELAMEGHRFFDLQRWDKEQPGLMADVLNRYILREKNIRPLKAEAQFTKGKNEIFPIPQNEIDQMNADGTKRLTQNPGY